MFFRTAFTLGAALCLSVPAILQAGTAPAITTQPAAVTVALGKAATFSVTATGTATLRYQWRKNGINISGATTRTYTTPATTSAYNGVKYQVYITNGYGAITSKSALLTVTSTPIPTLSITTQPVAKTVTAPATATFNVVATGSNLTYQWKKNGTSISGATAAIYTTPATTSTDNGSTYLVTVTSGTQSLTSQSALLTVMSNTLGITTQPKSQTVTAPDGATFTVGASGSNLSYQWRKNGTAISGATSANYTTGATDLHEISAMFSVVVSSGGNSVTSENATMSVMAPNPTYAGDPVTVPNRPQTVLPSYTLGAAFPNGSFRFGYDEGLKNPLWTAYANFKFITAFANGTRTFAADTRLASPQVTDGDYSGSGWTRGHQVMMSDLAYRYGAQAGTDTCRLSNIAPQSATHNNNFWNNFEQVVGGSNPAAWVPGLADTFKRIWIYTGPVFNAIPQR
ncbi:MAG: DNA/RNA non-specific endonuclease, partial [Holophaga sp.]|nr:DNA/RNA non-specific endonuclease [Holophaga sp.]